MNFYFQAASTLKNAEGLLSIVVAKPHRVSNRSDQGSTPQLNQGDSESAQIDPKKDQSKLIVIDFISLVHLFGSIILILTQ